MVRFLLALLVFVGSASATEAKIKIGAMAELTGPGAENGEACKLGYQIAEDLFQQMYPKKAATVEVLYGDHRAEQKFGISEFRRFQSLGVWAVVANRGPIGAAINPLSKAAQLPLFGVMGHENFVRTNPYALRMTAMPVEEGGGLARQAFADGVRKVGMLLVEDDYILAVGQAFAETFKQLGGTVVYRDYFVETANDFAPIAARIRAARPEALFMTLGFQQFGPAIRRLREQSLHQPLYANFWLSYPSVIESAGGAKNLEGSVFITERSDYSQFSASYQRLAAPGRFKSGVVYRCYTALGAALNSLAECADCSSPAKFAEHAANLTEVKLADGPLSFSNREARYQIELYRFKSGRTELISRR